MTATIEDLLQAASAADLNQTKRHMRTAGWIDMLTISGTYWTDPVAKQMLTEDDALAEWKRRCDEKPSLPKTVLPRIDNPDVRRKQMLFSGWTEAQTPDGSRWADPDGGEVLAEDQAIDRWVKRMAGEKLVSPEQQALEDDAWKQARKQIADMTSQVRKCEAKVDNAVNELKAAKALHRATQLQLLQLCEELSSDGDMPLFAKPAASAGSLPLSAGVEPWRDFLLSEILSTMAVGTKQCLVDGGFDTLGQLADHTNKGKLLTEIPGIGEAKAAKIESELDKFWARYNYPESKRAHDLEEEDE